MMSNKFKSIASKALKYLSIIIVSLLSLLFIAPLIFSEKIETEIKKVANTKLNGELNYSDAKVSFFSHFPSLTITLNNFKLNGSAPYKNEPFITADQVSFGINVSTLIFSSTVNIDQIYLEHSKINVKVNKKGEANYNVYIATKNNNKKDNNSETALKLEKIQIKNSHIIYDDQSTKIHFDAIGFNYLGNGDLSKDIFDLYSKAQINQLNIIYENEPYLMNKKVDADLITKINVNSLSFIFEENNLKINKLPVDFKGKFDFLKNGYNIDFIVKSTNSNLDDLFTSFPPKYITWLSKTELKGKTDLLLTLKGKYSALEKKAPNLNLDIKVRDGFVNYNSSKFPVSNLNFDISTQLPSLNPELLIVNAKNLSLNIATDYFKTKLYLKGIHNPEIEGYLNTKIDLEKLNRALGIPEIELKGILTGEGNIKGKYDAQNHFFPTTNMTINLKNGFLKTKYYPNPITDINIISKITNQKGTFHDLKIIIQPTQFNFEGKPVFVEANLNNFDDLTYDIKANGTLDISRIYKVFSQKGLEIDGSIKANLALKGKQSDAEKGYYNKLHNKGTLELRNILLNSEYLPKSFLIKEGIFKINQDKMTFNSFLATYGQSDLKMNGYLQNVFNFLTTKKGVLRGAFKLNSKYINANEFMSTNTPKASTTGLRPEKTETGVILIPSNFDLRFQANSNKISFNGLTLNNARGSLEIKNSKLKMKNSGFSLIGCTVNMNAIYQGITPQKAQFEYDIKASDFDIKRAYNEIKIFREMASAAEKAQGTISLNYKLKGKLNKNMEPIYPSLIGNGVVSIKDIKLYGMKMFNAVSKKTSHEAIKNPELTKVDIKSTIRNNIITIERFKFKFAGFRPRIEGKTSLDGKLNLKMRLGLPPLGIFGVPLVITGNKDNPKIKIGRKSEELEETKDTID